MQVTCSGWRKHTSNMCPASGPKTLKCCYGPPGASAAYVRQISFPNARVWVWFFKNSRCSKLASEVTLTTILSSWTPCEEKSMQAPCSNKGGLISEVFHFCSNLKKNVPNPSPEHSVSKEKILRSVIWQLFLDLSQSEKSSEIMPPLGFDPTSFNSVCIENCSDQMWEKNCPSDREKLLKIRCLRPRICTF